MASDIPSSGGSSSTELVNNTIIVVLGASGDLAKKKTFPALFGLFFNGFLPEGTRIIGYARTKMEEKDFHDRVTQHIKVPIPAMKQKLDSFLEICSYVSGQYNETESFKALEVAINEKEKDFKGDKRNRIFYMALPPSVFTDVAKGLKENNYSTTGVNRIVVEKPFGMDLPTSRDMMGKLKALWKEEETFRIDHYLGKEMVKNLLVLRFGNVILDASFNKSLISNVQITFKEPFGTEGRGGYFDEFGIIRDVMQNHLLQVLSLLTMERPVSFSAEDIRDEKVKVLRFIPPILKEHSLLGQYVASGDKPGYLDDDTVPKGSICPTFAALVLYINSPRWEGVPFVLRAGKALNEQKTEIRIQYKDVTQGIFKDIARNELVIRVQPGEAVYMKMNAKAPGLAMKTVPTEMDLTYKRRFSDLKIPEAYEALILDAIKGDRSNFVRDDELDIAWKIFTPLLHYIDEQKPKPESYEYGSRGPATLDDFITKHVGYKRFTQGYRQMASPISPVKL
ncbi:uncharacterized protein MELLADRAFT_74091 [Melampsora larici-populina 98AG31]|uniref:Glucose-6-phosphate 1-dehydrogenase n=1 Tax=Melampsora larici-populina (strain 98AG31 / pathotype 3-4-7) TaxID=747676 RepID=F4R780_MELLP|nr:uncharacterized protein MELLADRAFT_74091 [Melampsora larici-populina 98AG31]EGG11567.1 hypothetical protein MELLADRAFT_74091 [Melampsora larici-populina 98AG31]